MAVEIVNERLVREEVVQWVTDDLGYYAYTSSGLALNIVRSASVQLPIEEPGDYFTYLWLETLQGFFLARQRIVESTPQGWWLVRELMPAQRHSFFHEFHDGIEDYLVRLDARLRMEDSVYEGEGLSTSPVTLPPGSFSGK